ncbi:NucA/NucB deoxyribonuclease domain-containing protein [Streptomyces sp. NPDC006906]|uniref:NucA/NucB deoxyribonuclease domain-containing protein n=1 Tax=Streptomyces sp. NPDC006906 TaxID=3154782 RepID=UPI0033DEF6BD
MPKMLHYRVWRGRAWVALATAAILSAGLPSAAADTGNVEVVSSTLPAGVPIPSLSALQAQQSSKGKSALPVRETAAGKLPREAIVPARSGLPKASTPSFLSEEMAGRVPFAATYPEPPRTMTKDECKAGLQGGRLFAVKSRYAMCTGTQFVQTWMQRGRPVGQSSFTLWVIETVPKKNDRTMRIQYLFTDFVKTGTTRTSGLRIDTDGDVTTWPKQAAKKYGGQVPPTQTFDALKAKPEYTHTMLVEPGQGTGTDDVVQMAYEPFVKLTFPSPYTSPNTGRVSVGFLAGRWDTASYLFNKTGGGNPKKKGGAALPLVATLPYSSQSGAPERAVAQHLQDAHTKPGDTKPVNASKAVPGFDLKHTLHRLQHDGDRVKANRRAAIATCVKYWGADYATSVPGVPRECDEYPFASTYEGAAQSKYDQTKPKDNFSARPLPKADNGAGGSILKIFMDRNRILDGFSSGDDIDAYVVSIS